MTKDNKIAAFLVAAGLLLVAPLIAQQFGNAWVRIIDVSLLYVLMALGLNIVVGFAGLLDLGYVAFYALGAFTIGWFGSGFYAQVNHQKGIHFGVTGVVSTLPGIHLNFLLVLVAAVIVCAIFGVLIGLPTLRLRGDYIAIVTLA